MTEISKVRALELVEDQLQNEYAEWAETAEAQLLWIARFKKFVTVDDLWEVVEPPEGVQSKVGGIMNRGGRKDGFLKKTNYRCYSERGNHDNVVIWESLVFEGGDESFPKDPVYHVSRSEQPVAARLLELQHLRAAGEISDETFLVEADRAAR